MKPHILIIDDERSIRNTLKDILEFEDYKILQAEDGKQAIELLAGKDQIDCILCDIKMPGVDGMEVLDKSLDLRPQVPIIMISGHGNIDTAVEAVKKGAFDYISKPPDLNKLLITIRNAIDRKTLVAETVSLQKKIAKPSNIIGESESLKHVLKLVDRVAPTDARVLVTGANGVGKELIAKRIHELSDRAVSTMVEVNCAAIPSELIESELFGHEKGSFTSAVKQHLGKFEQAHGSTLFLDEVGDMSLMAQAKVLRALQEGKVSRIGGSKDIKVNVRVIAATNKDLQDEIKKGNFREDLYHRLSVVVLKVPPLTERKEDLPKLIDHFIEQICQEYGKTAPLMEAEALEKMKEHLWPGNIRELRNVVERLIIFTEKTITAKDVDAFLHG